MQNHSGATSRSFREGDLVWCRINTLCRGAHCVRLYWDLIRIDDGNLGLNLRVAWYATPTMPEFTQCF